MQKLKLRSQLNFPGWGSNSLVKSGTEFQSSDSDLVLIPSAPYCLSCAWTPCLATFILLLNYFLILQVITFVETQSNLRKANVQLFLSANSSPKSGTPIICLQGTWEQLDLEKPSSTITANKLGTGWKTERLGHYQTEGRKCTLHQRQISWFNSRTFQRRKAMPSI